MKIKSMLSESFECVKIGGILRNLTNDEMKIYKKVKENGKLFKNDLEEFDQTVASSMVSKGLLRRVKSKQENGKHGRIYFITRGRKGQLHKKPLEEVAPPDRDIEKWIKKNKNKFKNRYGDEYEKYLYGKAWKRYNGKKSLNESVYSSLFGRKDCINGTNFPQSWIAPMGEETYYYAYFVDGQWYVDSDEDIPVDCYFNIKENFKKGMFVYVCNDVIYNEMYEIVSKETFQEGVIEMRKVKNDDGELYYADIKTMLQELLNQHAILVENEDIEKEPENDGSEWMEETYKPLVEGNHQNVSMVCDQIYDLLEKATSQHWNPHYTFSKFYIDCGWDGSVVYDNVAKYKDCIDQFKEMVYEVAQESHDYDVEEDVTEEDDVIYDRINEQPFYELWHKYVSNDEIKHHLEDIKNYLQQRGGHVENTEPTWDGDNDNVQPSTPQQLNLDEDELELYNDVCQWVTYMNTYSFIPLSFKQTVITTLENFINSAHLYSRVDGCVSVIEAKIRDAAFESGDFHSAPRVRVNHHDTLSSIYDESMISLVNDYVDSEEVEQFLLTIKDIVMNEINGKYFSSSEFIEPESTGEEFDESYLSESVLMEDDDEMQEAYREVLGIISDYENGDIRRAEDAFAKLCEEGYWRHETLFDYDSEYADACEDFYDVITDTAINSGNYDEYSQGEIDIDATFEAIDDEELGTLWEKYANESIMREYLDDIIENVSGDGEYTTPQEYEPTWSGEESEFGQVQQVQNVSIEDDEEEVLGEDEQKFINDLNNLMENINHQERRERMRVKSLILDLIRDYIDEHGSYTSNLYDKYANMCQYIRDEAYTSGDFNRYEEGEYDSDATWDNMREYDDADLVERHVGSSVINDFLSKIQKICSKALGIEDDEETKQSSEEPESTGEEFDESYKPKRIINESYTEQVIEMGYPKDIQNNLIMIPETNIYKVECVGSDGSSKSMEGNILQIISEMINISTQEENNRNLDAILGKVVKLSEGQSIETSVFIGDNSYRFSFTLVNEDMYATVYQYLEYVEQSDMHPDEAIEHFEDYGYLKGDLYRHDREYETVVDEYCDGVYDDARDSGRYDEFTNGEIDYDATIEDIDNNSMGYLWSSYANESTMSSYLDDVYNTLKDELGNDNGLYGEQEPTWDGSENDVVTKPEPQEQLEQPQADEDLVNCFEGFETLYQQYCNEGQIHVTATNLRNNIYNFLEEWESWGAGGWRREIAETLDGMREHIRDAAYESGDFNVYNRELDYDATNENIWDERFATLVRRHVDADVTRDFFEKIKDVCRDNMEGNLYKEEEPESTGEEFDESYLGESHDINLSDLLNRKVINNKDNKVGKVTSIGFHRIDGKKVDDIFITDLMSNEEIKLSKKEFLDNWNVLPYEKEIKKQDDSDDEEIYQLMRNIILT